MTIFNRVYKSFTQPRQPGVNTVAYYPLNTDLKDSVTNTYMTAYNGATLTTLNGVECLDLTSNGSYTSNSTNNCATGGNDRTHVMWAYYTATGNIALYGYGSGTNASGDSLWSNVGDTLAGIGTGISWSQYGKSIGADTAPINQWVCIGITISNYLVSIYINGSIANSYQLPSSGSDSINTASGTSLYFGKNSWDNTVAGKYLGEFVSENKSWDATEFSNYYNSTKGNYGL